VGYNSLVWTLEQNRLVFWPGRNDWLRNDVCTLFAYLVWKYSCIDNVPLNNHEIFVAIATELQRTVWTHHTEGGYTSVPISSRSKPTRNISSSRGRNDTMCLSMTLRSRWLNCIIRLPCLTQNVSEHDNGDDALKCNLINPLLSCNVSCIFFFQVSNQQLLLQIE